MLTNWQCIELPAEVSATTLFLITHSIGSEELSSYFAAQLGTDQIDAVLAQWTELQHPTGTNFLCERWRGTQQSEELNQTEHVYFACAVAYRVIRPIESQELTRAMCAHFTHAAFGASTRLRSVGSALFDDARPFSQALASLKSLPPSGNTRLIILNENASRMGVPTKPVVRMLPSVVAEVLASLPYGVMIIDNVGNIQYLNQMALVLLDDGLQQDTNVSILEQPWVNQLELVSKLSALISHGRAFEAKRIHPPSGSNTIGAMSARGFPLQRYAVSVLLISDASREMESQRLALVASELQVFNDVVGRLAHEFNNALLGVRGHADRLMERMERDDAGYQLAGQLHHASQQMIAVVDGLLMLVRGDSAGSEASVDCNAVAATAIKISRQELPQNIELHLHTTGDIPHVSIGRAHLEYVLLNLIRQARDNIQHENVHRGGRIDVNLQQTDAGIHIEIANDGPVQPIVITEALFDPLHGLGEPNHGRGLGLPVSRGIVHAVGGELNFRSSIDSGTVVELRLPPLCAVPSLSPKGVIPKAPASVSILVVEDNDIVRELCVDVLQQEGYATQVAITGADAVRIASHSSIDLAIVDLGLPDMDGLEAAAALGVPVILVSGNPPALFNRVGELRDEWRFLKKPFGIPELLNCVGELLEKVSLGDLVGELGEHSH